MTTGETRYWFIDEIYEQPQGVSASLAAEGPLLDGLGYALAHRIDRVTLVGCGDPYFMSHAAAAAFQTLTGLPARAVEGLEFCLEGAVGLGRRDLVITISQSGRTIQAVEGARLARGAGAFTLGVTNTPGSPLTGVVDGTLLTHCGPSRSFPTKTTTSALALLYRLALPWGRARAAISDERALALSAQLDAVAERMGEALALEPTLRALAEQWREKDHFSFLGAGAGYATALQAEAKLKETSQSRAEAHPLEEFAHLHIFALRAGDPLVVVSPGERVGQRARDMAAIAEHYGAQVVALVATSDAGSWRAGTRLVISTPALDEVFSPLVQMIPLQLLAYHLALLKGRNPDRPQGFDNADLQRFVYAATLPEWEGT